MIATLQHRLRARLRDAFADLNAPLLRRVSALELAYQEQREVASKTYREVDASLDRLCIRVDALDGTDIDHGPASPPLPVIASYKMARPCSCGDLERVTAQRDELTELLASTMGERDSMEQINEKLRLDLDWQRRADKLPRDALKSMETLLRNAERDRDAAEARAEKADTTQWERIAEALRETGERTVDGARDEILRLKAAAADRDEALAGLRATIAERDKAERERDAAEARAEKAECHALDLAFELKDAETRIEKAEFAAHSAAADAFNARVVAKGAKAGMERAYELCREAEARAHDLANQVTALQCAGDVDKSPIQARWVSANSEVLGEVNLVSDEQTVATVRMEAFDWRWRVFIEPDEPGSVFVTGADSERSIAKEQALEEVRVHWGQVEVVE